MLSPSGDGSEDDALEALQTPTPRGRLSPWERNDSHLNWEYVVPASGAIVLPSNPFFCIIPDLANTNQKIPKIVPKVRMLGTTYFPKKLPVVFGAAVVGYLAHGAYLIVKSSESSTPVWYQQSISSAQTKTPK